MRVMGLLELAGSHRYMVKSSLPLTSRSTPPLARSVLSYRSNAFARAAMARVAKGGAG